MAFVIRKLIKSESQPIIIPIGTAGGTQIYFPDNQYIRDKKLMGITLTVNNALSPLPTVQQTYTDGTPLIEYGDAIQIYLTLESYAGVQFIRKKPIGQFNLNLFQGVGVTMFAEFIGQKVNWPKSYIEIANGTPAYTAKKAVLFDIEFTELSNEIIREQLAPTFGQRK